MPGVNINLQPLIDEITNIVGVADSVVAFINGIPALVSQAVTAALEADDAADQGSIDAANAAIADAGVQIKAQADKLTAAITANP